MSRQLALDTINLKPTPRLGHTEYVSHDSLMRAATGVDAGEAPSKRDFLDAWEVDLIWNTDDGPRNWAEHGRVTDMGHAAYQENGLDLRTDTHCPFKDPEEILEFDAVKEYGLPDFNELVTYYQGVYDRKQTVFPNQLVTGGYYKSVVSGASESFGWDMFLMAAGQQERFAQVLESFGERTLYHVKAWAETTIEVFIQHDDMVWTEGPFMAPGFYREAIFPLYRRFWDVLHRAGKKVLYCCDGTFDMFMDDIVEAGADGFIFEPSNDFESVVERFGKTHCIVGSKVDCRTLTFRTWEEVKREMDETFALVDKCNGLMWAVGNHIPHNVPVEMAQRYMDYLRSQWAR